MPSNIEQEQLFAISSQLIQALDNNDNTSFFHLTEQELSAQSSLHHRITPGNLRQQLWHRLTEHKQAEVIAYLNDIQADFLKNPAPKNS